MAEHNPGAAFVGRQRELADLIGWMDEADSGRGRLALLVGPPGIGKSRLAAELATVARDRGRLVLAGRGWADAGTLPYWPWIQVLRAYLRAADPVEVTRLLATDGGELARIVPEVAAITGVAPADRDTDPDVARFRLFDAVTTLLRHGAGGRSVVVLLEDLHAADTPSILLLRFLVSQLGDAPVFIVATYRELELPPTHPSATAVEQLGRDPNAMLVHLAGLQVADASRFIETTLGSTPKAEVVAALWRETRGNPLFLAQAAHLLNLEGSLAPGAAVPMAVAVPAEIREVILRRVGHVGTTALEVLSHAAVLGPEFHIEMLGRIVDRPRDVTSAVLIDAAAAGLVVDIAGTLGQYRFAHDLIRESLHGELTPADRVALHRHIVETIESVHGDDLAPHVPALAYHALEAMRGGGLGGSVALGERAIDYARRAGDQAVRASAFEEAARLFRSAIAIGDTARAIDDPRRLELLSALGDAESRASNLEASREVFLEAIDVARRLGSARDLALAAIGYGGRLVWARAGHDTRLVPLLQEALVMLGGADDRLRSRLLARLACAMRSQPEMRDQGAALSQQAVEVARAIGDEPTLSYALGGRAWAIWWPDNVEERMAIAREVLDLARRADDPERIVDAHTMLALSYVDLGQLDRARAELREIDRVAGHIRQPAQRWLGLVPRASLELAVGNFAEAERLMASEVAEGHPTTPARDDVSAVRMHRYLLARERGTFAEVEPHVRSAVEEFPWYPLHRGALANLLIDLDRSEEARALLHDLGRDEYAAIYEDNQWLLGMSLVAEAASRLGDRGAASVLYRRLLPRAGRHAVGHPEGSVGSTDRYLGLLARTLGDLPAARVHLEEAVRHNARMGVRPWTAHAQADLAEVLELSGADGDIGRADQLRREALATATAIGMPVLEQRLRDRHPAVPSSDAEAAVAEARFLREGEYWTIAFDGVTSRLRDTRGLGHIARLLATPGIELHALDLATESDGAAWSRAGRPAVTPDTGAGAGPQLDDLAKAAYRERLRDLEDEVTEADAWNDTERASRARSEIEALTAHLSAAMGLGGRDRSAASNAERARLSVTRAIRSAIERIGRQNDPLRLHLEATIHTGTFCSYRPDPRIDTRWQLH